MKKKSFYISILSVLISLSIFSCIKKSKPTVKNGTFVIKGQIISAQDSTSIYADKPFEIELSRNQRLMGKPSRIAIVGSGNTDSLGYFNVICDLYTAPVLYADIYTLYGNFQKKELVTDTAFRELYHPKKNEIYDIDIVYVRFNP